MSIEQQQNNGSSIISSKIKRNSNPQHKNDSSIIDQYFVKSNSELNNNNKDSSNIADQQNFQSLQQCQNNSNNTEKKDSIYQESQKYQNENIEDNEDCLFEYHTFSIVQPNNNNIIQVPKRRNSDLNQSQISINTINQINNSNLKEERPSSAEFKNRKSKDSKESNKSNNTSNYRISIQSQLQNNKSQISYRNSQKSNNINNNSYNPSVFNPNSNNPSNFKPNNMADNPSNFTINNDSNYNSSNIKNNKFYQNPSNFSLNNENNSDLNNNQQINFPFLPNSDNFYFQEGNQSNLSGQQMQIESSIRYTGTSNRDNNISFQSLRQTQKEEAQLCQQELDQRESLNPKYDEPQMAIQIHTASKIYYTSSDLKFQEEEEEKQIQDLQIDEDDEYFEKMQFDRKEMNKQDLYAIIENNDDQNSEGKRQLQKGCSYDSDMPQNFFYENIHQNNQSQQDLNLQQQQQQSDQGTTFLTVPKNQQQLNILQRNRLQGMSFSDSDFNVSSGASSFTANSHSDFDNTSGNPSGVSSQYSDEEGNPDRIRGKNSNSDLNELMKKSSKNKNKKISKKKLKKLKEKQEQKMQKDIQISTKACNCPKSRCIKKYCICYADNKACNPDLCVCTNCENNPKMQLKLLKKRNQIKKKNSFNTNSPTNSFNQQQQIQQQEEIITCNCNGNTKCLKKYCECYKKGILCGDHCKCVNCENRDEDTLKIIKQKKKEHEEQLRIQQEKMKEDQKIIEKARDTSLMTKEQIQRKLEIQRQNQIFA